MPWLTPEEREEWAEDHGYYHFTCRKCGVSGWTDTTPDCNCGNNNEEEVCDEENND